VSADEEDDSAVAALGVQHRIYDEPEISGRENVGKAGQKCGKGGSGPGRRGEEMRV
jgi:hypothetical protein